MNRPLLVFLALATSATAAAQHPCTVVFEAGLRVSAGRDSTVLPGSIVVLDLRFTDREATPFVKPGCWTTAKITVTLREIVTGVTVLADTGDCDSVASPGPGTVVALYGDEAFEMSDAFLAPGAGEYEVTVAYRNAPGGSDICRRMREFPRADIGTGRESFREVACQMEESTPCEIAATPFHLVVSPRPPR